MADGQPPRLLDRVRDAVRARHLSPRTEEAYVYWIRRFIVHHGRRHPREMDAAEVTQFLTARAVRDRVSASTSNQALSALLFLYRQVIVEDLGRLEDLPRGRPPERLPVVLTRGEVRQVLGHLSGAVWLVVALLYGAGLRMGEPSCRAWWRRNWRSSSRPSVAVTAPTWRPVSALPCCRGRWTASISMLRGTGDGSSCSRRRGSAAIPGGEGQRGITCTNRSSSAPWRGQRGTAAWPSA